MKPREGEYMALVIELIKDRWDWNPGSVTSEPCCGQHCDASFTLTFLQFSRIRQRLPSLAIRHSRIQNILDHD